MNQREHTTSEELETHEQEAFPFLSGMLALDFVNTDILLGGRRHDFLMTPEDAAMWWHEATLHHPNRDRVQGEDQTTQWNTALLESLKRLRVALRHLFFSLIEHHPVSADDLEEFNRILALGYQGVELNLSGELVPIYHTTEPQSGAVLLLLALSALQVLTQCERNRLHECANERCIVLFYDTTRSATRHWCSPGCMNRARSLQHYRQVKAEKAASVNR